MTSALKSLPWSIPAHLQGPLIYPLNSWRQKSREIGDAGWQVVNWEDMPGYREVADNLLSHEPMASWIQKHPVRVSVMQVKRRASWSVPEGGVILPLDGKDFWIRQTGGAGITRLMTDRFYGMEPGQVWDLEGDSAVSGSLTALVIERISAGSA